MFTSIADADFVIRENVVTISSSDDLSTICIDIELVDDGIMEGDEYFCLNIEASVSRIESSSLCVTIKDPPEIGSAIY